MFHLELECPKCNGGGKSDVKGCCTDQCPCDLEQGHCIQHSECIGSLTCGSLGSCGPEYLWSQSLCCQGNYSHVSLIFKWYNFLVVNK